MPASAMWGLSQASQPVSPGVKWGQSEQPVTALSSPGARLCWKGSQALAHLVLVVTAPEASVLSPHHRTWGHLNDTVAGRRSEQCLVNRRGAGAQGGRGPGGGGPNVPQLRPGRRDRLGGRRRVPGSRESARTPRRAAPRPPRGVPAPDTRSAGGGGSGPRGPRGPPGPPAPPRPPRPSSRSARAGGGPAAAAAAAAAAGGGGGSRFLRARLLWARSREAEPGRRAGAPSRERVGPASGPRRRPAAAPRAASGTKAPAAAAMKPGPPHRHGAAHGPAAGIGAAAGHGARGLLLPPLLLLLLLAGRAAGAQRWRNENFERPVDLEGSGDDDSFPDDELDDLYSGSGSGYFEQESGIETAMRFSPDVAMAVSTTAAVLPTVDIQPVGTPFEELPSEHPTPEPATSPPVVTEVPEEPSQRATTISTPTAPTAATTAGALTVATVPATVATAVPSIPAAPPSTATTSVIRTTGVRRLLPLPLTTAATARATTPAAPSPPTTVAVLDTEAPTPRMVSTATSRPRALPRPATTQEPDLPEKSTLPLGTTAPGPTEVAQTPTLESVLTTIRDEPEVPVSGGPSGDFELPEEETTQPDTANEVVAVGGAAAKPSPPPGTLPKGARPGPGLLDNAIDSGSSAAQLPQKSILERKEVLVAVIVGGVVGALFAAFLVTLLIYRMKKKDEGSYTLEEPKQASVTYQKPDKQEEFYA
ncbi:syndecan-3 [Canis lupus dingo]|uniref:syndecan-3 n=1 Tax=Canis lupus dingo TaxID=286419 RepID=UPI0020C5A440|nr:syndecan-3 [Canis lupus dingo]